jgi:hypothetical protein
MLTMMPPFDHTQSRREILGEHPSVADTTAWSVERQVDADVTAGAWESQVAK